MSYILDALRRAEAQRSRGAIPTLHAPVIDAGPASGADLSQRSGRRWLWPALGAAGILLGLAVWMGWPRPATLAPPLLPGPAIAATPAVSVPSAPVAELVATRPGTTSVTGRTPAADVTEPVPTIAPRRAPAWAKGPTSAMQPAPAPTSTTASAPTTGHATAQAPITTPAPVVPSDSVRSARGPSEVARSGAVISPRAEGPSATPRAAEPRLLQRRELPAEVQRELPPMAVSGTVYSSEPSQRIVIVNGELLHEGDRIGPEVVLEEIRRKDAVLRYKGQRFSISP